MLKMPIRWHFKFRDVVKEEFVTYLIFFSLVKSRNFPFMCKKETRLPSKPVSHDEVIL